MLAKSTQIDAGVGAMIDAILKMFKIIQNCGHPSLYYARRLRRRQSLPQADKLARLERDTRMLPRRFQILSFPISMKIAE
ncbi:MAG: hypothetical protein ACLUKN_11225 [Bacilli bacterium]